MSNADEFKLEFPPFSPDVEESWDDYKKKVRNKFGNKYDAALNLSEGFGDFMEANSKAFMELSPEEQEKFLIKQKRIKQNLSNLEQASKLGKIFSEMEKLKGEIQKIKDDAQIQPQEQNKDSNDY